MGNEDYVETASGLEESGRRKPGNASGGQARTAMKNIGGAISALIAGTLPVYFIVFAIMAYRYNNAPVESPVASWLLAAAKYVSPNRLKRVCSKSLILIV